MRMWGPFALRLALGVVFVAHGLPKLVPIWGQSPSATAIFFDAIGLRPAYPLVVAVGLVEVASGVALVAGLFTFPACIALIADVLLAALKVHLANGFFINWSMTPGIGHGIEFHLVLLAALLSLVFTGAGELSVDSQRARSAEEEAQGRARLRSRER
jgi:putative oxidoreductase